MVLGTYQKLGVQGKKGQGTYSVNGRANRKDGNRTREEDEKNSYGKNVQSKNEPF